MKWLFVPFLTCMIIGHSPEAQADVREELRGITQEIREKKQLLKKTKRTENKVSGELQLIERTLHEKETTLAALARELKGVETGLGRTQLEIDIVRKEAERKKEQIKHRLASVYKAGEMGHARMFFSSETLPQMLENQRYMRSVLTHDRQLFKEYDLKLEQLRLLKASLEREINRKEKVQEKIRLKKQEIESEKTKKADFLSQVRQEKINYQASLKELVANARRLQAMVERLEARNRKSYTAKTDKHSVATGVQTLPPLSDKGFGAQRGRLAFPVSGDILSSFGKHKHPEFNSYTINNGISIAAPLNAEIRSVFDGQVIFAERFKGYGNMVIVDHGGGYFTLYAHAARITKKTGATVARNETIASVGDTDSTKGPMLYFEIRYQGKPVDPGLWLH